MPKPGTDVVAFYKGDAIPETPQDATSALVVKRLSTAGILISTDNGYKYPANNLRGRVVACIPQRVFFWTNTDRQEVPRRYKQYLSRMLDAEREHQGYLTRQGLKKTRIDIRGIQISPSVAIEPGQNAMIDIDQVMEFVCPKGQVKDGSRLYFKVDTILPMLERRDGGKWAKVPVENEGGWKVVQVSPGIWRFRVKTRKGNNFVQLGVYRIEAWSPA